MYMYLLDLDTPPVPSRSVVSPVESASGKMETIWTYRIR